MANREFWKYKKVFVTGVSLIGLHRTIDWYFDTEKKNEIKLRFKRLLTER